MISYLFINLARHLHLGGGFRGFPWLPHLAGQLFEQLHGRGSPGGWVIKHDFDEWKTMDNRGQKPKFTDVIVMSRIDPARKSFLNPWIRFALS